MLNHNRETDPWLNSIDKRLKPGGPDDLATALAGNGQLTLERMPLEQTAAGRFRHGLPQNPRIKKPPPIELTATAIGGGEVEEVCNRTRTGLVFVHLNVDANVGIGRDTCGDPVRAMCHADTGLAKLAVVQQCRCRARRVPNCPVAVPGSRDCKFGEQLVAGRACCQSCQA